MTSTEAIEPPTDVVPEPEDRPIHVARCPFTDCPAGVKYQLTSSGHGAIFHARYGFDDDTFVGLNEHLIPLCPFGHGEMELADEHVEEPVSAADAISQVSARQMQLLESPPFNHGACLHELYQKSHEIATLKKKVEDRKESLKIAKEDYDHANEELGKMIAVFEEREQQRNDEIARRELQAANGHPEGTTLVKCLWEQQNPASGECPICSTILDPDIFDEVLGLERAPRDASAHVDQVERVRSWKDVEQTAEDLEPYISVSREVISGWTPKERHEARAWALAVLTFNEGIRTEFPAFPDILGRPHIACIVLKDEAQCCTQCDRILRTGGADAEYHEEGRLVGVDCKGKPVEAHRYPKTDKPKKSRKKKA